MPSCISVGFLACMGYPGLLFLTMVPSLLHASGSSYTQPSVLSTFVVQHIILRRTVRQRGSIKFWRICWAPVYSLTVKSGMNVCHLQNFLTTTATWRVSKWPLLRHYMGGGVGHH